MNGGVGADRRTSIGSASGLGVSGDRHTVMVAPVLLAAVVFGSVGGEAYCHAPGGDQLKEIFKNIAGQLSELRLVQ